MFQKTCLFVVLGLGLAQIIQPSPLDVHHNDHTIISDMSRDLKSSYGSCGFPPADVLSIVINKPEDEKYHFLHKCNVKLSPNRADDDDDILLCMTLYDIGLKMCNSTENKPAFDMINRDLPQNSDAFQKLVTAFDRKYEQDSKYMCSELISVLQKPTFPQTINWNLKTTFTDTDAACDRLCHDYKLNEKILCKLILYGSKVLKHSYEVVLDTTRIQDESKTIAISSTVARTNGVKQATNDNTQHLENESKMPLDKHLVINTLDGDLPSRTDKQVIPVDPIDTTQYVKKQENIQDVTVSKSEVRPEITDSHDDLKLKTSSQPENRPSVSDPTLNVPNAKETYPSKPATGQEKSDSSPLASNASVKPVVDGAVDVADLVPPEGIVEDINGGEVNNDGSLGQGEMDDGDQIYSNGLEAPDLTGNENHNSLKVPQDADDVSNNGNVYARDKFDESEESHFFTYFTTMVLLCIIGYLVFHNKQKILALVLEGRSRRNNRRRPNTANYHKLDCNLEEAVSSPCSTSSTHVIY